MQNTLEKLSYTTVSDFYKNLQYTSQASDAKDIEDTIQDVEDSIFMK